MWVQPEITQKLYVALWAAFLASCFFPYRLVGLALGKAALGRCGRRAGGGSRASASHRDVCPAGAAASGEEASCPLSLSSFLCASASGFYQNA